MQRYITCLHLPFFASALQDPVYAYSRKATVDSSLKIWSMACPASSGNSYPPGETDLARMCRCTAGFFRMYAFHGATFLAKEPRTRIQEDENDLHMLPLPLQNIVDDAANWYLGCIQVGETGMKGYLLLRLLGVWIDATKHHINQSDLPVLLVRASEQAVEVCIPILEALAGTQEPSSGSADMIGIGMDEFDFQLSPDFTEDWDMLILDTFNTHDMGTFDAFLL